MKYLDYKDMQAADGVVAMLIGVGTTVNQDRNVGCHPHVGCALFT